jgi:hypothetical protein
MHQKYMISQDGSRNKLKIGEYAIIDKNLKNWRLYREGKKEENNLNDLFIKLKEKGFMRVEIPWLIKDLFNIFGNSEHRTITAVDQELEELGWGISIMDNAMYELASSLVQ